MLPTRPANATLYAALRGGLKCELSTSIGSRAKYRTFCRAGHATSCGAAHSSRGPFSRTLVLSSWRDRLRPVFQRCFGDSNRTDLLVTAKPKRTVALGDFQTPIALASTICSALVRMGVSPASVIEPTCGTGSFLRASGAAFTGCNRYLGFDINPTYAQAAGAIARVESHCTDFFQNDWSATLDELPEPILVIGNPPWVTNSTLATLGVLNVPPKSNHQHASGMDAITGKSNFDISEWMLSHLLERLSGREATLAMLCKTSVARKALSNAWSRSLQIAESTIFLIDAAEHFGVSVSACLLVCVLKPGGASRECAAYSDLGGIDRLPTVALRSGRLIADKQAYDSYGHLVGTSPLRWRSGIKHDGARIMQLRPRGHGEFTNGLGDIVKLEPTYLYPMLKGSDLAKPVITPARYMLVTQRTTGEDTSPIASAAPLTWAYLMSHAGSLDARASSIYRNRPRFSIFGVGPYSFAPWKVATPGFSKHLTFRCVGPVDNRPVVLDDTCYFLPCRTEHEAQTLAGLLNSEIARGFFRSFVFWDAKRPITAGLLMSLDIGLLAEALGVRDWLVDDRVTADHSATPLSSPATPPFAPQSLIPE